jgi:hypothetical protein
MRERLTFESSAPTPVPVVSLTRSGSIATVVTGAVHTFPQGHYVTIAGATPAGYNRTDKISVVNGTTFTYLVDSSLATPATGTITATYTSDPQGSPRPDWHPVLTGIPAELRPIGAATERLMTASIPAIGTELRLLFRLKVRHDITGTMRVRWVPTWPPGSTEKTLQIIGVLLEGDGRAYMNLECVA